MILIALPAKLAQIELFRRYGLLTRSWLATSLIIKATFYTGGQMLGYLKERYANIHCAFLGFYSVGNVMFCVKLQCKYEVTGW
jgi:hypothetical protein